MIYDFRYQIKEEPLAMVEMLWSDEQLDCSWGNWTWESDERWMAEQQEIAKLGDTNFSWRGREDFYQRVLDWLQRPFVPVLTMEAPELIVLEEPDWTG